MGMKDRHRKLARERFWSEHRKEAYDCPDCGRGMDEIHRTFEVHHINGDPHDNSLENLIAVCRFCHAVREGRKPGSKELQNFLKSRAVSESDKQTGAYIAYEEVESAMSHIHPPTRYNRGAKSLGRALCKQFGFESNSELLEFTPRTRREAAAMLVGRYHACVEAHDYLSNRRSSVLNDISCQECGAEENLCVLPDRGAIYELGERKVLCGDCGQDFIEKSGHKDCEHNYADFERGDAGAPVAKCQDCGFAWEHPDNAICERCGGIREHKASIGDELVCGECSINALSNMMAKEGPRLE